MKILEKLNKIYIVPLLGALVFFGFSTKVSIDHKGKIEFIQKQIKQTEELLKNLNHDKNNFITQIKARQGLINHRNELIKRINKELTELNAKLLDLESQNKIGLKRLAQLRNEYEKTVRKMFIHKLLNWENPFITNVEWTKFLKKRIWQDQLNKFRINRFLKYKSSQQVFINQQEEIKNNIIRHNDLLNSQMEEKLNLEKDIEGIKSDYKEMELKAKDFQDMIQRFNKEQRQLENIIQNSIRYDKTNNGMRKFSPNEIVKYPIKNATIVSRFGIYKNHENPQITLKNNGIDLRSEDSFVSCVSESTVQQVKQLPNGSFVIICRRDNYFFVYSNLDKVFIKQGEALSERSNLGELKLNKQGTYELHFEVWQNKTPIDPMIFLSNAY